jgi:hypothetical protein
LRCELLLSISFLEFDTILVSFGIPDLLNQLVDPLLKLVDHFLLFLSIKLQLFLLLLVGSLQQITFPLFIFKIVLDFHEIVLGFLKFPLLVPKARDH